MAKGAAPKNVCIFAHHDESYEYFTPLRKLIFFVLSFLMMVCVYAGNVPTGGTTASDNRESNTHQADSDTIAPSAAKADTATLRRLAADTTLTTAPRRRGLRYDSAAADTARTDTIKKREPGIDAPVDYECSDSLVYDATTGLVHLYGKAKVKYMDMTLDAAKITMCMDSNKVTAEGLADSTGVPKDIPVYHQGADEYTSERMAFNFKTKKGFIQNVSTKQGDGFLTSQRSKRSADGTLYLEHATYTTCDAEHPHFYIALSRAKARPGKETVSGPAYLVV